VWATYCAGKVLRYGRDGLLAELLCLEALEVGHDKLAGELGVLAHRVGDAAPPWLSREIDLRVEGASDPNGQILLSSNVGELLN
jgi:hypothetical protein